MPESMTPLIILGVVGALFILLLSLLTNNYSLNNIKSKTVGDGQYGTARWATTQEIKSHVCERFRLTLRHGAPGRSLPNRAGTDPRQHAARQTDWMRWWTVTMCIAS